jgi:nucleoside-diphosphate-sugar epimerase
MKIAITGGAGFLGLHLALGLRKHGHEVRLLDIASLIEEDFEGDVPEFMRCDVREIDAVKAGLEGVDAVIHGAAALPLWKREEIMTTNIQGTENVLSVCRDTGISRVVHISSTAVYGVPEKHPIYEDDPMIGVGAYGESKIEAERVCERYRSANEGLCVAVIRPKTFIGPARLGVFEILFDWVDAGARIPVIGNGHNRYQLLDVADLAEATHLALTRPAEVANDTFNVGAERFDTVREDLTVLCEHAGSGARVMGTPAGLVKLVLALAEKLKMSPLYKWVYGTADKDSFVSIDRAKEKLGWQPQYSNSDTLVRAYDWYHDNKDKIPKGSGVTHRIGWDQGILKIFKKVLS